MLPHPMNAQTLNAQTRVRLTPRGRLVVVLFLLAAALLVFSWGRASATGSAPRTSVVTETTVAPGESLWAVSQRVWPGSDPRDGVRALTEANHLSEGSVLQAGTTLQLR
jgi:hypothetical protein